MLNTVTVCVIAWNICRLPEVWAFQKRLARILITCNWKSSQAAGGQTTLHVVAIVTALLPAESRDARYRMSDG